MAAVMIRAWFGEWKPSTPEHALEFARMMYYGMMIGTTDYKIDRINTKHLKGIKFRKEDLHGLQI